MVSPIQTPRTNRRKPFERKSPDNLPPFRPQEREYDVVRFLADQRIASSEQIARAVGGSPQHLRRRLAKMFDYGIVERAQSMVAAQLFLGAQHHMHYYLTPTGHRLADELFNVIPKRRYNWTQHGLPHVVHEANITEFSVSLREDARERGLQLLEQHGNLPYFPMATQHASNPFRLSLQMKERGKQVTKFVEPDRMYSIHLTDDRINLVLERQRLAHEPNERSKSRGKQNSSALKFEKWWLAWQQEQHTKEWGFKRLIVATLVDSNANLNNLIDVQKKITGGGSRLFWFSTMERVLERGPLAEDTWIDGNGNVASILE